MVLLLDVVRTLIPESSEDTIRTHISSCLAQAGDRDGGRKSRQPNINRQSPEINNGEQTLL